MQSYVLGVIPALAFLIMWIIILPFGIERCSRFFSCLVRFVGQKLKYHKIVVKNIQLCFPELSEHERHAISLKAWENLGAIIGESFFFKVMSTKKVSQHLTLNDPANMLTPGAKVVVALHMANFEIIVSVPDLIKVPGHFLYAKQKNPYINRIIYFFRRGSLAIPYQNRTLSGLKALNIALKNGEAIILLCDQRAKGCMATFFSQPVQTSTLAAKFALNHQCPLFILKLHRTGVARYHLTTESIPVLPHDTALTLTQRINDAMEAWIRQHPEQWCWMHNRFRIKSN